MMCVSVGSVFKSMCIAATIIINIGIISIIGVSWELLN